MRKPSHCTPKSMYRNRGSAAYIPFAGLIAIMLLSCSCHHVDNRLADAFVDSAGQQVKLSPPYQTKSVRNYCSVIGWPADKTPLAPAGFKVNLFAGGLDNPRNILV